MGDYNIDFKKMVVDAYKNRTCSVAELAAKYKVSTNSIYRWVKKDSLDEPSTSVDHKRPPDDIDWAIVEMYQSSNLPVVQIASKFGVSSKSVYRALRRCGVHIEKRQRILLNARKYTIQEQVIKDYATGKYGCRALAEKYGVCFTTIARWVKELK